MKGFNEIEQYRNEQSITQAYMTAAWQRSKKMPKLSEVLKKVKPKKPMTSEQMLDEIKKLNAAFGGTVNGM